jgi:hypothetical protein
MKTVALILLLSVSFKQEGSSQPPVHISTDEYWKTTLGTGTITLVNSSSHAQYYDLTVGTERSFYDCGGLLGSCLPSYGANRLGTEKVVGEIDIYGTKWAIVEWTLTKDFHPNDEDAWMIIDTSFYRTEDTRLYQYTVSGDSLIFDFDFSVGDSLRPRLAPFMPEEYTPDQYIGQAYRAAGLPSVVLIDTMLEFPNNELRRVVFADDTLDTDGSVSYQPDISIIKESFVVWHDFLVPQYDGMTLPFYYIEGIGVMRTPINHRHMNMWGYYPRGSSSVDNGASHPEAFVLYQNYPNPFNPATTIQYVLPARTHVNIKIFNILGQEVASLVNTELEAGIHEVIWNAASLPSGVYYYRLRINEIIETKKMILLH